jgi:hypothetical protein
MQNEIINLIQNINKYDFKIKQYKLEKLMSLEDYLTITYDRNLNSSLYELFNYDDEEIFYLDYDFMIENIFTKEMQEEKKA